MACRNLYYNDDYSDDDSNEFSNLSRRLNGLNIGASTSKGKGQAGKGQTGKGQTGRGQSCKYQTVKGRTGTKLPKRLKTVESIATYYEEKYSSSTYKLREQGNPVYCYTVNPVLDCQVDLPLVVRSLISTDTVRPPNSRERFTARIHRHFDDMQATYEDERGHVVSSKLGGPNETYNIFPQLRDQNRHGDEASHWRYFEQDLEIFMENNPRGSIDHIAVLIYDSDERPYRPTEIGVSVRLYNDNRRHVDLNGRRVTIATNDLENYFFVNE